MWHQLFKRNFENQWEYFVRKENNNLLNNSSPRVTIFFWRVPQNTINVISIVYIQYVWRSTECKKKKKPKTIKYLLEII